MYVIRKQILICCSRTTVSELGRYLGKFFSLKYLQNTTLAKTDKKKFHFDIQNNIWTGDFWWVILVQQVCRRLKCDQ